MTEPDRKRKPTSREPTTNDDLNDHAVERAQRKDAAEQASRAPRVGSRIWRFDPNHRRYTKPDAGQKWTGAKLIWRASWVRWYIVGETRVSWSVSMFEEGAAHLTVKVKKSDFADPAWRARTGYALDDAELDDLVWKHENVYRLSEFVLRHQDAALLRQVAKLLGYVEEKQ